MAASMAAPPACCLGRSSSGSNTSTSSGIAASRSPPSLASGSRHLSLASPAQRRRLLAVAPLAAKKGFSGGGSQTPAKKQRGGKPSSRQGQLSRKELEKQAVQMKEIEEVGIPQVRAPPGGRSGGGGGGGGATVPQVVTDRMLKRIIVFAGLPVMSGLLLLPGFYYLKVVQHVDLPPWIPVASQSAAFGAGLLGISYGILSASWDPSREGSASGVTELRANLPIAIERFRGGRGR